MPLDVEHLRDEPDPVAEDQRAGKRDRFAEDGAPAAVRRRGTAERGCHGEENRADLRGRRDPIPVVADEQKQPDATHQDGDHNERQQAAALARDRLVMRQDAAARLVVYETGRAPAFRLTREPGQSRCGNPDRHLNLRRSRRS
jgi:hypothetical protein